MPVSRLTLANFALAKLTRDRILDLDGKDPSAVQMSMHMDQAIDEVIEAFDWSECRVITTPVQVSVTDTRDYTYAYQIPSDCVVIHGVQNPLRPTQIIAYEIGMNSDITSDESFLFTNESGFKIRYGSRRCPLHRFTPSVIDLMALRLAIKTCLTLGQDKRYREMLKNEYIKDLNAASTRAANREPEVVDPEFVPELITVRSS